jgi:hypothetical protein
MSASSDDSSESGSVATGFTGASHASSASSASAASNSTNDAARLAERIHCKLCSFDGRDLPVKSHRSAVNAMVALRALLLTPIKLGRNERMLLLYAGISIQRRKMLSDDQNEVSDLEISLVLLFVLQLLCEAPTVVDGPPSPETDGPPDPTDPTDPTDEQTLEKASTMSLTQQMEEASTKKPIGTKPYTSRQRLFAAHASGLGTRADTRPA